jgi:arylsulfatase A-like enzyme
VLVTIDALRASSFDGRTMPALWRFASGALRFDRAYAPATSTQLSIPALLVGESASRLAPVNLLVDPRIVVARPLGQRFSEAGYLTAGIDYFLRDPRSRAGFAEWNAYPDDPKPHTIKQAFAAASLANAGIEFVRRAGNRPFLLWLHVPDPHAPHLIPDDLVGARDFARRYTPYEFELAYTDHHVGRLLAFLEESDALQRTIVAVTADHGESLGERGKEGHGTDLFEEVVRVPLVLRVPGCSGRVIGQPVTATALVPTLAALAGLPGRGALLPFTPGPSDGPVVVESALGPDLGFRRAVVLGHLKLLHDVRNGGFLLFDLASDPGETRDLYGTDPGRDARLLSAYQHWLDESAR